MTITENDLTAIAQRLGEALKAAGQTLATAESCTGGWVAKVMTDIEGSSAWFDRGFVTYTNESKQEMLGVSAVTLSTQGAVSEATVKEMAQGALQHSHADLSLAISGIAGPGGGTIYKPVGTVCLAWASRDGWCASQQEIFSGDRHAVRMQAVFIALQRVLKKLPDNPKTRRLFFALWPDDDIRQAISRTIMPRLQDLAGRKVSQHQWHITLAFLGNISDEVSDCVQLQAQKITVPAFDITLDTVGHWSRPKVVWLGCHEVPGEMQLLVSSLNAALKPCRYEPEYADFKAHMTLMRKVSRKPKSFQLSPIAWRIDRFVLVESQLDNLGSTYKLIGEWKLPR